MGRWVIGWMGSWVIGWMAMMDGRVDGWVGGDGGNGGNGGKLHLRPWSCDCHLPTNAGRKI